MKKLRILVPGLVILALLFATVPVFAQAPAGGFLHCPKGQHEVCTSVETYVCDWSGWNPWTHEWECWFGHTEVVEDCSCVADDAVPVAAVAAGPVWVWPPRTCADQSNCVLGEDAEYTWDEAIAPPEGTLHMVFTSFELFEWSYLDPLRNVVPVPGIDGWWNGGADRTYLLATDPFSAVGEDMVAIPSSSNEKAPGVQFVNSPTKNPILLYGTFEGPVDDATIEANRWRTAGLADGQLMRMVVKIFSCRGALLD
ncbi:MAG: hypothetical protein AB9915_02475 [Candidatus Dojkabacteria bacterium]